MCLSLIDEIESWMRGRGVCEEGEDFSFILDSTSFKAILDILGDGDVKVKVGNNYVSFTSSGATVKSRLVEGRFPNFKSVIPQNGKIHVKADCGDILDALQRCGVGAGMIDKRVELHLSDDGSLVFKCEDYDMGKSATETVSVESDGSIAINFNIDMLSMVLSSVPSGKAIVEFSEPSKPLLAREMDADGIVESVFVLTPII